MVRHFQEEEALPALPDLPKAVKVASYFVLEREVALNVRIMWMKQTRVELAQRSHFTPLSRPTDLTQGDVAEAGDEKRNVAVREASSELDGEGRAWEKVGSNEHSKAFATNCHLLHGKYIWHFCDIWFQKGKNAFFSF